MTISPQIRIVALVGLVAALGLGASMMLFGHSSTRTQTEAVTTTPAVTTSAVTTPAATTHATATAPAHTAKPQAAAAKPHATTKAHTAPAKVHKHHAKPKPAVFRGNPVYANLPAPLQWELAHHKVVVVSIYNPRSSVDAISVAEAHQGAVDAKVGFLLVNVLDNKVAGLLTALLPGGGLLPDPGVLVYRAPGNVALRIDGFADRNAVAQAALNVVNGESGPVTSTTAAAAAAAAVPVAPAAPAPTDPSASSDTSTVAP
jgi:hypothetical protein